MSQMTVKRTFGEDWPFLEPAMHPDKARTMHGKLLAAAADSYIIYRKGQILLGKNDGSNLFAKIGTADYAGRPRIMKYSVIINDAGEWQMTESDAWDSNKHVHGPGSIDMYYTGYFKTQDLTGAGGTNEVQTETLDAAVDGGTRTLRFEAYETEDLAWDASNATIQAALEALPNLRAGDVVVSGTTTQIFTFGQDWAGRNVPMLVPDYSGLTDGGVPFSGTSAIVETTPGAGLLTGVGRLVMGTNVTGIVELGAADPS